MRLYEKYRPKTLSEVVGQPKAVATIEGIIARGGFGGQTVLLTGQPGVGKTTLARIIAATVADPAFIPEYDCADDFGMEQARTLADVMHTHGFGTPSGRAWIINEAHGLREPVIRKMEGVCERLPAHCVVIFTTTKAGEEQLFGESIEASAFLSRAKRIALTNQGLADAMAPVLKAGAMAEGLDGQPIGAYKRLMQRPDVRNNVRAAWQVIEAGAMIAEGA